MLLPFLFGGLVNRCRVLHHFIESVHHVHSNVAMLYLAALEANGDLYLVSVAEELLQAFAFTSISCCRSSPKGESPSAR